MMRSTFPVQDTSQSRSPSGRDGSAQALTGWALIAEVDAAIRSVLATQDRAPQPGRSGAGAEIFGGRLFALRHAESLPEGTREVGLAPGTVVTPLARDLLKARRVAVRSVSKSEVARVRHPGEWGFAIDGSAASGVAAALRRTWLEEDWTELEASLDDAARWVTETPVRGALVMTDEASVAVWRACRMEGVRAASVADPDSVARAVRRLGVNLVVVEPSGKSISWIRQLGLTFRRSGAPGPPAWFEPGEGHR
jgi:hypothetical protein